MLDAETRSPARRTRAVAALTALALLAAGTGTAVWLRQSGTQDTLISYSQITETATFHVGEAALVGADVQPRSPKDGHQVVDVEAVLPRITANSAHARVQVLLCRVADPQTGLGSGPLSEQRSVCASLTAFRPGPIDLGFPTTEVGFEVTASQAGTLRVEGADVTYRDGVHNYRQHVGSGFVLHFAPAS